MAAGKISDWISLWRTAFVRSEGTYLQQGTEKDPEKQAWGVG